MYMLKLEAFDVLLGFLSLNKSVNIPLFFM